MPTTLVPSMPSTSRRPPTVRATRIPPLRITTTKTRPMARAFPPSPQVLWSPGPTRSRIRATWRLPPAKSSIVDDNGTPGNPSDDLSTSNGKITFQSVSVGDGDTVLEPGEVWLYKATGTVQTLSGSGGTATFDFSGNTALDGPDGNIRTFTAGSVSVKASAFSRDKSSGAWSTAYLGSYGGGLGVTDSSEGDGSNNTAHGRQRGPRQLRVIRVLPECDRGLGLPGLRGRATAT